MLGVKVWGHPEAPSHGADGLEAGIILKHVEAERSEIPQKGHAGDGVVIKSSIPNGRHAVWNGYAGELLRLNALPSMVVTLSGMVTLVRLLPERRVPNGRNAVWNGHAGEAVVRNAESQWS